MADSNYVVRELDNGSINISQEVVAVVSAVAAAEVEGVVAPAVTGSDARSKKNLSRYVKVESGDTNVSVEINITVAFGCAIDKVCAQVQEKIATAVESVTGLKVVGVNVNVKGVSFDKK